MEAGVEPGLQARLGMTKIDSGNRRPGKTQLLRPGLELFCNLLEIEFVMHAPDHTAFSAFLPDEAATLQLGSLLARAIQPGMTIYLEGDLGAGKTTLTRGILRGLDFTGRVKSPTYTLVESYALSNLYLYHFDLYRFADPAEWEDAGFRDYFNPQSVCMIEWADKAEGFLPPPDWIIFLDSEGMGRRIRIETRSKLGTLCATSINKPLPT